MKDMAGLTPVQRVMRLNPHAIAADGGLKPFSQQYGEYAIASETARMAHVRPDSEADSLIKSMTPFVLSWNCSEYGVPGIEEKPLVLSAASFRHILKKHSVNEVDRLISNLDLISEELKRNVLAYQDPGKAGYVDFILSELSRNGNRLTTSVRINLNMNTVDVASLRSIHGNAHIMSDLLKAAYREREFFVNGRTGAWLANQRHAGQSPSAVLSKHLLDLYHTHLQNGDGFYKPDRIDDPILRSFVDTCETDEKGNLIGLEEPFERLGTRSHSGLESGGQTAMPYGGSSLEVIEFEKSLEAMSTSIIRPCAEEAERAGECR